MSSTTATTCTTRPIPATAFSEGLEYDAKTDESLSKIFPDLFKTKPRTLSPKMIEYLPLILALVVSPDMSLNQHYISTRSSAELLQRDDTFRQLLYDVVVSGKWSQLCKYPAMKIQTMPKRIIEGPHSVEGAVNDLFLEFERYRMTANAPSSTKVSSPFSPPPPLWLTVTFIRHVEALSNVDPQFYEEPNPPSDYGNIQLAELRNMWDGVRIDSIYSSDTTRTLETAKAIIGSRTGLELQERHDLIEQDLGPEVRQYIKEGDEVSAYVARTGKPWSCRRWHDGARERAFRPFEGESCNDVAQRAQCRLLRILLDHGVTLSEEPSETATVSNLRRRTVDDPHVLPANVPHVVLVSHNIFLAELYESLLYWEKTYYEETNISYGNADWSRHLIRLDWPLNSPPPKYTYREKWFGLRLQTWDLKAPRQ